MYYVTDIPHAPKSWCHPEPPFSNVLHVVTNLMDRSSSPGFNAEAHHEMMQAIGARVGPRGYEFDKYQIHAPDQK